MKKIGEVSSRMSRTTAGLREGDGQLDTMGILLVTRAYRGQDYLIAS